MNKSKRIAISLVAGVLAALLCMVYGSSIRSQAEQVQAETLAKYGGDRVEVCVAARDIDVGETLDETNVITQEWLTSLLPRDAATELRRCRALGRRCHGRGQLCGRVRAKRWRNRSTVRRARDRYQ